MKYNFKEKKDIERIKKISLTKYDFIILGSGPAAVTLSNKLISTSKNIAKILIIERGDVIKREYKKIFDRSLPIKLNSRVFSIGGSSNEWANISSYFEKFEMEARWEKNNKNLWPLSHKELIYYYEKLNKKYGFGYERLVKKNLKLPFEIRQFIIRNSPMKFQNLINFKKIDLIYNCEIKSIDDFANSTYAFTKKKDFFFIAKKLIVCCGGIETVNLILNSLKSKKLKNMKNKKLVGRYFMNHPKLDLGFLMYPKTNLIKKLLLTNYNNFSSYYGISLDQKTQKNFNMLNTYIRFERAYSKVTKFLTSFKSPLINNLLRKKNRYFYKVRLFCEMIPNKKNKIQLKKNNLHVDYSFSKSDHKTIELLMKKIINHFSFKPKKEKNIQFSLKYVNKKSVDASHHMGGLIFNHKKKETSIDKNLKINGLQNVYVCSSAIFPTSGSANPTMTIAALANRLGMHLIKKDAN